MPRHRDRWQPSAAPVQPPSRPTFLRRRRAAAGAVALALAACFAFVFVPDLWLRTQADVVTAAAEIRNLRLDDGSRVHLAPESAVAVGYLNDRRELRLIKGRAFFEVAPDPGRPFTVTAGTTTATVLGTAFDVRLDPKGARIAVREGRVQVDNADTAPPTHAVLSPGSWVRVSKGGGARQGVMPPDEVATWLDGELVARDWPAGDIADALRPYFKGAILVQSSRFAERRVSGIYSLKDPASTLAGLAESHGAVMRRVSPWLLVVTDW